MLVAEGIFKNNSPHNDTQVRELIELLLGALRMDGQILGREHLLISTGKEFRAFLLIPEGTALDRNRANVYVIKWLSKLVDLNVEYSWKILGSEPNSNHICNCLEPKSYILYTTYVSLETPILCGNCFGNVPLYRLPTTSNDEYSDILAWESDYKACDTLQMNCSTGERFGSFQVSRHESSLAKRGRVICDRLTASSGVPVYYYLLKSSGRSIKSERKRKCPACNNEWLLQEPLHGLFDFKCDNCRLLSNIAWSVQSTVE